MGYSYHPVSQDSACAGVMGMCVLGCMRVGVCVVPVTRNPEECYLAFFYQERDSDSTSGFQKEGTTVVTLLCPG